MAKAYVSLPVGYYRVDNEPLERDTRFTSYADALAYATTSPAVYTGQLLLVKEDSGAWSLYQVQEDKSLQKCTIITSQYVTPENIVDGKIYIKMDLMPKGLVSPSGTVFGIQPDFIDSEGLYTLDVTGLDIQGIWKIIV